MTHPRTVFIRGAPLGASRATTVLFVTLPAIILLALLGWKMMPVARPNPNGDPVAIAKFVNTHQFESLTENEKKAYMRTLRKKIGDVEAATKGGAVTKSEYAYAVEQAWMFRQLEHMENYYQLPPGPQREQYLDQLAEKGATPSTHPAPSVTSKNQAMRDEIEKSWLKNWPEDRRQQWEDFRKLTHAKKQAASSKPSAAKAGA